MDQIFISDLVARGIIGLNDSEREKSQEILINIILFGDLSQTGKSDDIKNGINYRTVAKKVLAQPITSTVKYKTARDEVSLTICQSGNHCITRESIENI